MLKTATKIRASSQKFLPNKSILLQLSGAAGLQAVQMGIGAIVGFLIIRHLSKEDYAIFNLLNTGGTTLLIWAGFSVTAIFIPFANRVGLSAEELRKTTLAFKRLNFPLFIVAIIVGLAYWLISAYIRGWLSISFITGLFFALTVAICQYNYWLKESAYKVYGKPLFPFTISLKECILRLALVVFFIVLILPLLTNKEHLSWVYLLISAITNVWCLYYINKKFSGFQLQPITDLSSYKKKYWELLRPILFPYYFFYISVFFRSSIIYLISSTSVIAEAAALGRIMALFAMMDKAVELVILPRLGAISDVRKFLQRLLLCFIAVLLIASALLMSAWLFPNVWLWILGEKYKNIGTALLWSVAASGVERLSGLLQSAQFSRGETKNQWWVPIFANTIYFVYIAIVGLHTVEQASIALFIAAVVNLMAQSFILLNRLKSYIF